MVEISKAYHECQAHHHGRADGGAGGREVDKLHEIIRDLKAKGINIIYVSHKLNEVKAVCDHYTVFRDGKYITSGSVAEVTIDDIVRLMVRRDVEFLRKPLTGEPGEVMLKVQGVSVPAASTTHATILRDMSVGSEPARSSASLALSGPVGPSSPGDLRRRPLRPGCRH